MALVGCGYSRPGRLPLLLESFDLTRSLREGYRVGWLSHSSVLATPADASANAAQGTARASSVRTRSLLTPIWSGYS